MNYLDKFLDLNGRLKLDPEVLNLEAKLQSGGELNPQKQEAVQIGGEYVPEYFYTTNLGIEDFPALAPKVYSANVDKVASAVVEPEVKAREADKAKADEQRVRFENALLQQASALQKPSSLRSSQDYMNKLSEQMKPVEGEFEPQKQDLLSLAVASLAPALAGLAVGGDAGYIAGGKGGEASQKFYAGLREQEAKERAAMAEQKSKRMVGQSEAAKTGFQALKEAENIEYDKLKTYLDVTKQIYGERSKEAAQAASALNKYIEQVSGDFMEAPKDLATFVDKEEGRQFEAEMQGKKDEAALERARVNAQAAAKRATQRQDKPTGEMLKASNYYGSLLQGMQQYDKLEKDFNGKLPSESNPRRFNLDFQLLASQEGTQAAGMALQSLSQVSPENRRQISNEIAILDAILRPKTGAAITIGEFIAKRAELFPAAGDSPQEKARKKARIQQELNNLEIMKGSAPTPKIAEVKQQPLPKEVVKKGVKYILQPNGKYLPEKK